MQVPFNDLSRHAKRHVGELAPILARVAASGWYILGKEVEAFEHAFARFAGTRYAIGVNSGTDALALAMRALDIGEGDEVVTTANTAVPTVAAIRMVGATPVFADIDERHVMDPHDVEKRITQRTKAIMPIHLYGFPADMEALNAIAKKHGLAVVEDAAQAHGATIGGKPVGSLGDAAAFSFYPTKNLGAFGDGGAITTNDAKLAKRLKRLRVYGEEGRYESVEEGVNSRLDEMQAALLSWALPHLPEWNARRREIAERYLRGITNPLVSLPSQTDGSRKGMWHLFVVQVKDRAVFMKHMEKSGIGTAIHYPIPIYRQKAYAFLNVDPAHYPMTETIVPRIVSLPLFPELKDEEITTVINAVNSYSA
ncbi:DegT/DnrJ/EryC1/StrS family aminotransferase [Candidatus Kaiserbacteria bacterium]|nr:DegT/DnrJ/EryC1/StrS family aminotransferase [Candidatus Kaiserbacteria bacterium]